jgi:glycosyltransferase involved in cell wall biosynthesis
MMLSVIIPSRNTSDWKFTQKTVDDLFKNAYGEIEVIVILDGYTLNPPLIERKNLTVIHNVESKGMRPAINQGVAAAKGKYIMKCDDHCAFAEGYDVTLANDCDDNWLAVPRRYSLDGENWKRGYGPLDYLYLTYPANLDDQFGFGMHGRKWRGEKGFNGGYYTREKERKEILIDDMLTCQGSCWFMTKTYFDYIGGMQTEGYIDHQEAQEMCFKVWLSGGRCVVNKKTWYAHLHKGTTYGRGYHLLKHKMIKSQIYSTDVWMNNKWSGQIHSLKWLIEKDTWWPLEMWPENWDDPKRWDSYNYAIWFKGHEIQQELKQKFISADELEKYLLEKGETK